MAGRPWQPSTSINQLTSPPDPLLSKCRRSRHTKFQHNSRRTNVTCSTDRYDATFVVAPSLGPPDCQVADFTDIQAAINALPPAGGKVFVKAGTYVVSLTIQIEQSNVHI